MKIRNIALLITTTVVAVMIGDVTTITTVISTEGLTTSVMTTSESLTTTEPSTTTGPQTTSEPQTTTESQATSVSQTTSGPLTASGPQETTEQQTTTNGAGGTTSSPGTETTNPTNPITGINSSTIEQTTPGDQQSTDAPGPGTAVPSTPETVTNKSGTTSDPTTTISTTLPTSATGTTLPTSATDPPGNYPKDTDITEEIAGYDISFGFEIQILNYTLDNMTEFENEFIDEMDYYYDTKQLPGFKELIIMDISNGSIIVNYSVVYTQVLLEDSTDSDVDAAYVNAKSLEVYYVTEDTKYQLNETYTQYEDLPHGDLCDVEEYCDANYVCTVKDDPLEVYCESQSQCLDDYCQNGGYCVQEDDGGVACWCPSNNDYWYSGDVCQYAVYKIYLIAAVSGGLLLLLIIFLVTLCCVGKCCKNSARKGVQENDEMGRSDLHGEENEHFHRFLETFQMPDMYQSKGADPGELDLEETKIITAEPAAVAVRSDSGSEIPNTQHVNRLSSISGSVVYADATSIQPYQAYNKPATANMTTTAAVSSPDVLPEDEGHYSTNIPHNPREQVALAYEAKNLFNLKRMSREIEDMNRHAATAEANITSDNNRTQAPTTMTDATPKYAPYGYPTSGMIPQADYL